MGKKILIIGLGSIGKRHLKNLRELGFNDISVVSRSKNHGRLVDKNLCFTTIEEACKKNKYDIAVIATPTARHLSDMRKIIGFGIKHIYLEKPISNNMENVYDMLETIKKYSVNVNVGYDLRFDLGLIKVKELISKQAVGTIVSFLAEVGQYLPDWRKGIDYRHCMSAKKELGGGVMLDLIHEFDYIEWLFGPIKEILGKYSKKSDLEIETEDISINLIETASGILGTLHLDYLQKELSRSCKIIGDKGTIIWDYKNAFVAWNSIKDGSWEKYDYSHFKRNDRFIEAIRAFMEGCSNSDEYQKDRRLVSFEEGISSLKLVEFAKKSNQLKKVLKV